MANRHKAPEPPVTDVGVDVFTVEVNDGIIWIRWDEGVTVDDDTAARLVDQVSRIWSEAPLPMFVRLNAMKSLSRCAMQAFARHLDVAALAIVGPSAVDRTIAEFFIRVHAPDYPVRYFTDPAQAHSWLVQAAHTRTPHQNQDHGCQRS